MSPVDPTPDTAAAEAVDCVREERPEPGLVVLVLDPPHRSLAVFDVRLLNDLDAALARVSRDASVRALVVTGREPLSFAAGADIAMIEGASTAEEAYELGRLGQKVFERLARLGLDRGGRLRTVAAVGGPVPGGACEIGLACDRIVLAEHPKTRIGLPETQLGIVPGWGGCTRLPRRIGVPKALGAILSGKLHGARQALKLGLVDRLTKPEYLVRIASDIAMGRAPCRRVERGLWRFLVDLNPLARALVKHGARKQVLAKTHGHYPAPLEALELVTAAPARSIDAGLEAEARALGRLATTPVTKSLVSLFLLSESAKKLGELADGTKAAAVARGGVIGAGVMGAEIASLMAARGIDVRLADLAREQLDAAVHAHRKWAEKSLKRRSLARNEFDAALDRLEVTTDSSQGFRRCDLVIEAVAERLAVKRAVLGGMAGVMPPDAILGTNTSSLSVAEIAAELPHPERVVGIHFFNPVRRMPLVEIVRGPRTSDEVVARAARFALDLGKTPVVVADVAGFLVNRLLGPYLDEAVRLFEAGADPLAVDRALKAFGMPMGPFELLDTVGLDIAAHAAASLETAYGARMLPSQAMQPLLDRGDLGQKSGRGFYVWKPGARGAPQQQGLSPALQRPAGPTHPIAAAGAEELAERLVLCMLAEGIRALEEHVVAGPRELDLATVFGMGFAPFRGGLLRYADARGALDIAATLTRFTRAPDVSGRPGGPERFRTPALLERLAAEGGRFHD